MADSLHPHWQPGLLREAELRRWAHGKAEVVAALRISESPQSNLVMDLASEILSGIDLAIDHSPHTRDRECRKGCPGCCHARISVTPLEACAIADHIRNEMSPDAAQSIHDNAVEIRDQSVGLDNLEYAKAMMWCPLLDADLCCSVYQVRPLVCRAWHSLSRKQCHDCYFANHVKDTIPLDDHAYYVGQGVRAGLESALRSASLDGNSYSLTSALIVALDNPEAGRRWAEGEDLFGDCQSVS